MALAETAHLITELSLRDQLSPGLARARGEVGLLSRGFGTMQTATSAVGGAMTHLGGRIKEIAGGIGILAGGVGALGLGAALTGAVTKARDFSAAMEQIHTQAGASQAEVDTMTVAIQKLGGSLGTSPEALAASLYHVESAGLRGAKALEVVTAAAQGAKVGNADLESVTNALVAAVYSGIKGFANMGQAMGVLNAVVGAGNMRMEDLTAAMGTGILSAARTFGLSITDVGAALATMTDQGVPAIDAATRLRMTFSLVAAPSSKAVTELKSIGLGALDLANDMRQPNGLLLALTDLKSHLDKSGLSLTEQANLLSQAFGGGRSSSAILTLLNSLDKLKIKYDDITSGANEFGDAWAKTQETAAFKLAKFSAAFDQLLVRVGNVILPALTDALGAIGDWFDQHGDDITNFFKGAVSVGRSVVDIVGKVVGAFNSLPGWVKEVLIKGFIANAVIKFALGFSPVSLGLQIGAAMLSKLAGGLGSVLSNVFGLGGKAVPQLIEAANPIPVWVTNPGFGGGGGPGGPLMPGSKVGQEAEQLAGRSWKTVLGDILKSVGALTLAAIPALVAGEVGSQLYQQVNPTAYRFNQLAGQSGMSQPQVVAALHELAMRQHADEDTVRREIVNAVDKNGLTFKQAIGSVDDAIRQTDQAGRHPSGIAPINPATVSDFALRHRTQVEKPIVRIDAAEFLKILRGTAFIGTDAYKSIWEKVGGKRGEDPFGQRFLSLLQSVAPAQLKLPGVMTEIRGHILELKNLEKYYIDHGDVKAAEAVDGVIRKVDQLIGVTRDQTPYQQRQVAAANRVRDAVERGRAATQSGFRATLDPLWVTARKKTSVSLKPTFNLNVNTAVSINNVAQRIQSLQQSVGHGFQESY